MRVDKTSGAQQTSTVTQLYAELSADAPDIMDTATRIAAKYTSKDSRYARESLKIEVVLAVLSERQRCAKIAEEQAHNTNVLMVNPPKSSAAIRIAKAINTAPAIAVAASTQEQA